MSFVTKQPAALKNISAFRLEAGTLEIVRIRGAKIAKTLEMKWDNCSTKIPINSA